MTVDKFSASANMAGNGQTSALEPTLHQAHLPAHAGTAGFLRSSGFKTYIVTGGGQDFVRVYSEKVYGSQPNR